MSDAFPTEFPEDTGALRWTCGILAITAVALACFNADAIAGWAEGLSMNPTTARIVVAADAWQGAMNAAGLGAPHADLHHVWKRAEAQRWPQ
jgi:hypothetical protein